MIVIFVGLKEVKGLQGMPSGTASAIKVPEAANDA